MIYIFITLAMINVTGFILTALDKHKARKRLWRIPEKVFFTFALLGGCPGVYMGFLFFRHKTRHWYFMVGIPAIFVLQLVLIHIIIRSGIFIY